MRPPRAEPSVLLVEDEMIVALDVEQLIEAAGLKVAAHALRGSEARGLFDQQRPDLCLVDIQLLDGPVGFECGCCFAEAGALVVFMTANAAALPPDLGGAFGVIAKPFTNAGLIQALTYLRGVLIGEAPDGPVPDGLEVAPENGGLPLTRPNLARPAKALGQR
jgi:CheY-like chemotaxis protein